MKPTLGCIVLYRTDGRNHLVYDLPAMITCTRDSHPGDYPSGMRNPLVVPSSDMHVHLTVFTPGGVGTKVVPREEFGAREPQGDIDFVGAQGLIPGSGTYVELDVMYDSEACARSWRWPESVDE